MQEKLKISAVICELNPLHSGHKALFTHAKQRFDGLVCLLSGNYVQRGEPAILDKWARTKLALLAGADLVIELPLPWALSGAERFAAGGVALARALGCVDTLLFGGETADIAPLWELAKALTSRFPLSIGYHYYCHMSFLLENFYSNCHMLIKILKITYEIECMNSFIK